MIKHGAIILFFVCSTSAHATLLITEISYNPAGVDTGYEWIEIFNNQPVVYSLDEHTLHENNVAHRFVPYQQDTTLSAYERVVIVDDGLQFTTQHPDYSGTIIDSAFSLSNQGEQLQILNTDRKPLFSVTYVPQTGGNGNGNTISLVDGVWQETYPTPGLAPALIPVEHPNNIQSDAHVVIEGDAVLGANASQAQLQLARQIIEAQQKNTEIIQSQSNAPTTHSTSFVYETAVNQNSTNTTTEAVVDGSVVRPQNNVIENIDYTQQVPRNNVSWHAWIMALLVVMGIGLYSYTKYKEKKIRESPLTDIDIID